MNLRLDKHCWLLSEHDDVMVEKCELIINSDLLYLGASPDCLASFGCHGDKLASMGIGDLNHQFPAKCNVVVSCDSVICYMYVIIR